MPRLVALPMRCAAQGKPFHALFEWNEVRNEYVLVETVAVEEASPPKGGSTGREVQIAEPASTSLARLSRSLVGLIRGKPHGPVAEALRPPADPQGSPTLEESPREFNLGEFNFSGFSCPVCGYGEKVPLTRGITYLKCGTCQGLVCGVRVSDVRGSLTFRCHDGCGGGGTLDEGPGGPMTASGILGEFKASSQANGPAAPNPEGPQLPGPSTMNLPPPDRKR